jgi:hypothetical protein
MSVAATVCSLSDSRHSARPRSHRGLLTPTREIAVAGCCANKTVRVWVWSAMRDPPRESGDQVLILASQDAKSDS